jgi:hypothetical protein
VIAYTLNKDTKIMIHFFDRDQDQRLQQDKKIEEIYLEGVEDGTDGRLPAMPDLNYLQGYCEGMRQLRMQIRLAPLPEQTEFKEFSLLCTQCQCGSFKPKSR